MNKPLQNVLAKRSSGDIAYLCGSCGREVDKQAVVCIHCGASLSSIRCPFCNFTGDLEDFKDDTCPKCGRLNKESEKNKIKGKKNITDSIGLSTRLFWILFCFFVGIICFLMIIFLYNFEIIP